MKRKKNSDKINHWSRWWFRDEKAAMKFVRYLDTRAMDYEVEIKVYENLTLVLTKKK